MKPAEVEVVSRKVRVPLAPGVARVLLARQTKAQRLQEALRYVEESANELADALIVDAGYNSADYISVDVEHGKDGAAVLVLTPPPLPMPEPPKAQQE